MKKLLVCLCAVSLVLGLGRVNEYAHALTMKDLIDNNKSITVFDKEFSGFGEGYNSFETDLSKVLIESSPKSTSNNVGIRITNTDLNHPWTPPGPYTLTFEVHFDVKTTGGSKTISDIEVVLVKGHIQSDDPDDIYLIDQDGGYGILKAQAGPSKADIDPHVASLDSIYAKVDLNHGSSVESFDVFISQIPEPLSLLLLSSIFIGLLVFRRIDLT